MHLIQWWIQLSMETSKVQTPWDFVIGGRFYPPATRYFIRLRPFQHHRQPPKVLIQRLVLLRRLRHSRLHPQSG